jgi:hypothetical protein
VLIGEKTSLFPSSFRLKTKPPLYQLTWTVFRALSALRVVPRLAFGAVSQGNSDLFFFQEKNATNSVFLPGGH